MGLPGTGKRMTGPQASPPIAYDPNDESMNKRRLRFLKIHALRRAAE